MANVQGTVFDKLERVRGLVQVHFPHLSIRELQQILCKLATYHYNRKKYMILGDERKIYNLLIENSYNPFTVYRWALLQRVPEEIKFQLKNHYLSQKKASQLWVTQRHETETSLQINIREQGLELIRRM